MFRILRLVLRRNHDLKHPDAYSNIILSDFALKQISSPAPLKKYSHFANIAGAKGKKHKLFYLRFSPSDHDPSHNSDGSVQLG